MHHPNKILEHAMKTLRSGLPSKAADFSTQQIRFVKKYQHKWFDG
jgi:hypothetical protein